VIFFFSSETEKKKRKEKTESSYKVSGATYGEEVGIFLGV
jgi:hypothetical protein